LQTSNNTSIIISSVRSNYCKAIIIIFIVSVGGNDCKMFNWPRSLLPAVKMCSKECTLTNVLNLSALGVSKNFSDNLMRCKKDVHTPLVSITCHIMYMAYYIARYIHIKVWGDRLCHFLDHIIWQNLPVTIIHNSNQFLCWISLRIVETATSDLNVMELSPPCPLCQVCYQGHLNSLSWHLTQHNGQELNRSIIDHGQCIFLNFLRLCGWWAYQEWFNRKNMVKKMPLN